MVPVSNTTPSLQEALADLNRQRKINPDDPAIAYRWCSLALNLGQASKVLPYAARLYREAKAPAQRITWSCMVGNAHFRLLNLEDASSAFTVSLALLIDQAEQGQIPPLRPARKTASAFASGAAETLLWQTAAALLEAGVPAFPYAGTLLGIEREGRLLPFDKDMDLGLWREQLEAGFQTLPSLGWDALPFQLHFDNLQGFRHRQTGLVLDLCGFTRDEMTHTLKGGFLRAGKPASHQSARTYAWQELITRDSPAGPIAYLSDPHAMLESLYGDWRTPNPWWDGMVSCPGIDEYTLLVRCFGYNRLLHRWLWGELPRAWAYAHQIVLADPADGLMMRARAVLEQIAERIAPGTLGWPPPQREIT